LPSKADRFLAQIALQRALCIERGVESLISDGDSKLGFALSTQGRRPINGLRHRPEGGTSGWYLWCGEQLSQDAAFFSPLHARHLLDRCPEAIRFLGLPPGYRFLLDGSDADVWFDGSLLDGVAKAQ